MSRKVTTVISFKIESMIEEWVKIIDIKEADLIYSKFYINPLFRHSSKDDLKKVVRTYQASEVNIQKFVQANSELIESHKIDLSTIEELSWI